MNKILKKTMAIIFLVAIIFTNMPIYVFAEVDITKPSVVISGVTSKTVVEDGKSLTFTVYFSDETAMGTVNMTSNHVALVGFTGTTSVSGNGNTRTVTISNIKDTEGTNTITIRAGAAKDATGNKTAVTSVSGFSIIEVKDTTAPSVVISKPSVSAVEAGATVTYKVTFSDETAMGSVNFNKDYVVPVGFTADISVSGTTVTLSNIQGAVGTNKYITIRAGAAKDAAGNKTAVANSAAFTIKAKDITAPSVVISKPSVSAVEAGATVTYKVTFSDETAMGSVNFNKDYVVPVGFTADISVSGTTVTLSNIQGTVGTNKYITIRAGAAKDAAGNKTAVANSAAFTIKAKDITAPSVVISKPSVSAVEAGATVTYKVTFSDETAMGSVNFNKDYVVPVGFTADISVSGTTVTLSNIQGTVGTNKYITIRAGAAKDAAGNKTAVVNSSAFEIKETIKDITRPSVVISKPTPTVVENGATVTYKVTFSDETAMGSVNFNKDYVVPVGFTADISVSGTTVTLSNIQGTVGTNKYITIRAGAAKDAAGNKTAVVNSSAFEIKETIKDITRPSVVISKPSPTTVEVGGTVTYTVVFSDETAMGTVNLNKDYVALIGFTADIAVTGEGNRRTVTLTNVQGGVDSDNRIVIRAGAAKDASGNKTVAVESSNFTVKATEIKDTTAPSIVISKPSPTTVEVGGTVTYTVVFSDERAMGVVNLNKDYIVPIGFVADISVTGTGNTRVVTLTNIKGDVDSDNRIAIRAGAAVDAAGNRTPVVESSNFTVKVTEIKDTTAPSIVISKPSPTTVEVGGTVTYTVVFSDERAMGTINFNKDYVALIGFTADIAVTGEGNRRIVTLTNIKGDVDSDNRIAVRAGAAVDAAGNRTPVVESSNFTVKVTEIKDTTVPSIVISKPAPTVVEVGDTVKYIVTFSDETAMGVINFNKDYVALIGFTANVIVTGEGNRRTVTLTNVQGGVDSDNRIAIRAGAAVDAAGNRTPVVESSNFTVKATEIKDTVAPVVKIESVKPSKVYINGTVTYKVTFSDNIAVTDINLFASKIIPVGFTADVIVKVNGVKSAEITLNNIKGIVGNNKYIKIASGVAIDAAGNRSEEVTSMNFSIMKKSIAQTTPTKTVYKANCIDDLELLGNINEEITYFASWLRAEKNEVSYPQENNYVVEEDKMTYMIEYFNGSTATAQNVRFELTIPYKVAVEEINGGGKIIKQIDTETVIAWNMGDIKSYTESKGTGFCRLYVKVRFAENKALKESKNISEVFYATLKTMADENESYSYMRQLFIDLTEGKTGTYNKYLTAIDSTNQVRPNDEITRAEFAKMLADAGIVEVEIGSKEYKKLKDYELIPSYARDAVSALLKTDIIKAFPDGTFKPSNPILVEDVMQMLAQAAEYISEEKLTVNKPVFIYKDALTGKDGDISPKKDYIMELMRQNVIAKTDAKPDTYALRKDVVAMVNSLTFRGPYVETLPENTLKFADIREDSVVFYNIVGASNSYEYTYDYRLWQQIIDIKQQ